MLLPNLQQITATKKGFLPLQLSKQATKTHIFEEKDLKNASLISLGQLCDDDCKVYLDKRKLLVYKNDKKILHGSRNYSDGLWDVHFPTNNVTQHYAQRALGKKQIKIIVHKDKTQQELAAYLHACAFSPTKETFLDTVKNNTGEKKIKNESRSALGDFSTYTFFFH